MTRAPAFKACLLYSIGILAGWYFSFSLVWLLASIVVCSVGAFLLWRKNHHSLLASFIFVLIIITLGVCKITWDGKTHAENSLTNVVSDEEQEATIIGVITERATPRQRYYSLIIEANSLSIRNRMLKVEGDVIVSLEKKKVTKEVIKSLFYGRKVSFTGTIRFPAQARNPGEFDYRRYLYLRGVYAQFRVPSEEGIVMGERAGNWLTAGVIHPFRDWISETMDVLVGGEEANLLKGLVIGERSEIDPDIKIAFTNAGLMHILAVSGLNVGLVTIMFWLVFSLFRIPRLFVGLLTALCLVIFAVLTGGEASVVRAVIMANVFIGAKIFEQKTNLFNVVGLAALFMLLIDARWLFNVGFQLSFVAVLALAQIYPRMEEWMKKFQIFQQSHSFFKKYLFLATVVSLAATIGTLPFTIYYFHQFSIIGIFMNIIAVPLSGFVLVFGCLVVLTSGVSMSLGAVYALPAYWSARLLLKFTEWGGGWSHSAMELYVDLPTAIVMFIVIIMLLEFKRPIVRRYAIIGILVLGNIIVYTSLLAEERSLTITMLDVGQGDAILVEMPNGRTMLVDVGPRTFSRDAGANVVAPFLKRKGIDEIDALIISHPHSDHLGGAPSLLRALTVNTIYVSGAESNSRLMKEFNSLGDSLHVRCDTLHAGRVLQLDPTVRIYALHPFSTIDSLEGNLNNHSVVLKIVYGTNSIIFCGDAEEEAEKEICSKYGNFLDSDVIKVGHHGSITSSSMSFLEHVAPSFALISLGYKNKFHHPSPEVLRLYERLGSKIARTDKYGAIILESNGTAWQYIEWREH